MKTTINGKDLLAIGYPQGRALGAALELLQQPAMAGMETAAALALLKAVKEQPENYLDHEALEALATIIIEDANAAADGTIALNADAKQYAIYGAAHIEEGARKQMATAMKLPVTVAGALMPDAHQGYGLPIGGVLATKNAIIPYGVGVDIGCRMALTIFDIPETHFLENTAKYKRELIAHTKFGAGAGFHGQHKADHAVLERDEFNLTPFIKQLHDKAWTQLGSSGGGNHFVEFGKIEFAERDEALNIEKGTYLALLTHSGSRGLGATIAGYYTRLAKQLCKLPQ
ncbi:MAG TPA: RtcB family protein, partial [Chitinophaga sp.]|uniref:RtcB family protein n=1 Tax=Chitinophaga sp. TaxID=1869181 RepID=UPI002F9478F9